MPRRFLIASLLAGIAPSVYAQRAAAPNLDALSKDASVARALAAIESDNAWTLAQQVALCEIPSPPFKEARRAAAFKERLETIGVSHVHIDGEGNVIGEIRGTRPGHTVLLSGHLDTVFPEGTDVTVKKNGTRMASPGIGDDCRGLAVVLAVARQIVSNKVPLEGRVLVVGTVGEEGAGDLRGVRALFNSALKDSIDTFLSVDGIGFGITNRGVGSHRYRVHYVGPGGHSYGAFGMPNPIHAMGRAIAHISDLQVPTSPKVTFSVSVVSGGTSVNAIPSEAVMEIDLRSESAEALATLDGQMQQALRQALNEERARWPASNVPLALKVDTTGVRPAGTTPDTSRVVRVAQAAAQTLNVKAPLQASSTDANIAMSRQLPAITIDGGGRGSGAHSLGEWYDDGSDGFKGPQWVLLMVLGVTGVTGVPSIR